VAPAQDPKPEDIVTRVSKAKSAPQSTPEKTVDLGFTRFDRGEYESRLDKLRALDPTLALQVEAQGKSFQADYTRRVQEIKSQSQWTPERVQQIANDPSFIAAAKQVYGSPATEGEDDSLMTEEEKQTRAQLQALQAQLGSLQSQQQMEREEQLNHQLQQTYSDYSPQAVNQLKQGLISGQVIATNEHLWKVLDYENAVQRAYRLGMDDAKNGIQHNARASSPNGSSVTSEYTPPARGEKESNISFLSRMISGRQQHLNNSAVRSG
jgi:hypothetical protein